MSKALWTEAFPEKSATTLTAKQIQQELLKWGYASAFMLPNYTPANWFECDVFQVTKAGLVVEYEIKISKADFNADAKKAKERLLPKEGSGFEWRSDKTKHEMLAQRSQDGPSRFYFVLPMALECDIPSWAGEIRIWKDKSRLRTKTFKQAPLLHSIKIRPAVMEHARGVCYWRMHRLIQQLKTTH